MNPPVKPVSGLMDFFHRLTATRVRGWALFSAARRSLIVSSDGAWTASSRS